MSLDSWETIKVPLEVHLGNVYMHRMHRRDLRSLSKMKFVCLVEISNLVCPVIKNIILLKSWEIIGVPLDIHFGILHVSCAQA